MAASKAVKSPKKPVIIRFVLDLQAEDTASVDIEFVDEKQAKKAVSAILNANGATIAITGLAEVPVLLKTDLVAAAFTIEYDEDDEE